jgi:hypothetical protein
MAFFSQESLKEINALLDEGFERLDTIEDDLRRLTHDSLSSLPHARLIGEALDKIDAPQQLAFIDKTRAAMQQVADRVNAPDFSDDDARRVCDLLDDVKKSGHVIREAADVFNSYMARVAETN